MKPTLPSINSLCKPESLHVETGNDDEEHQPHRATKMIEPNQAFAEPHFADPQWCGYMSCDHCWVGCDWVSKETQLPLTSVSSRVCFQSEN